MFKELYDNNAIFLLLGCVGFVGMVVHILTNVGFARMIKVAKNIANTEDKNFKELKNIFEQRCKKKENVYNVDSFVDKYVYSYKFCGLNLSTLYTICGQVRCAIGLFAVNTVVLSIYYNCGQQVILSTIMYGFLVIGVLEIFRKNVDNSYICRETKIYLTDYLDNVLRVKYDTEVKKEKSESIISKLNKYIDSVYEDKDSNKDMITEKVSKIENKEEAKIMLESDKKSNKVRDKIEIKDIILKDKEEKSDLMKKESIKEDKNKEIKKEKKNVVSFEKCDTSKKEHNVNNNDENSIINEILKEFLA